MVLTAGKVRVMSPRPEERQTVKKRLRLTPMSEGLPGKAICLINNDRPNAFPLLESIAQVLSPHFPGRVTREQAIKERPGWPTMTTAKIDRLSKECSAAIYALCS
ncbi:MAG: hypothetical protein HYX92_19365 [Chloroflexi bacterium]|nr:hypothetical protein [Chloroflexota bacterium]